MIRSSVIFLLFFLGFLIPHGSEAGVCSRWLKQAGQLVAKPFEPLYLKRLSLKDFGEEKFFEEMKGIAQPRFHRLEEYFNAHPDILAPESIKKNWIRLALTYRHVDIEDRFLFNPKQAQQIFNKNWREITLFDVAGEIQKNFETIRKHLTQVHIKEPRFVVRFTMKYKWLILGTTVFVLWDPVQAEIRSWVYWAFNSTSLIFERDRLNQRLSSIGFESGQMQRLQENVKSQLRSLYFDTNDRYPTTMQMSRNNLSYVMDMVQKRRDELAIASLNKDEVLIRQKLTQLYLIPLIYDDVLGGPLGGFIVDILNESYHRFDPEKEHFEYFKNSLNKHLSRDLPKLQNFDQR
jgi:hypothetical protein